MKLSTADPAFLSSEWFSALWQTSSIEIISGAIGLIVLALLGIFWRQVLRFLKFLSDLRVRRQTSIDKQLTDASASGAAQIQATLDEERAKVAKERSSPQLKPRWIIEELQGMPSRWHVWNRQLGSTAKHVRFTCDSAQMRIYSGDFAALDGGADSIMIGELTVRGKSEGATLGISWRDQYGDEATDTYFIEPPDEQAKPDGQGVEAAREERRRARSDTPTEPPLPMPRWSIYQDPDSDEVFHLKNTVARSVAREVRLEAYESNEFDFYDGAHWQDGTAEQLLTFRGNVRGEARFRQVVFSIHWYNEKSELISRTVALEPLEERPEQHSGRVNPQFAADVNKSIEEGRKTGLYPVPDGLPFDLAALERRAPAPRWKIYPDSDLEDTFHFCNLEEHSVAKNVRLDAQSAEEFEFFEAAQWDDMSGTAEYLFNGRLLGNARFRTTRFSVRWFDQSGQEKWEPIVVGAVQDGRSH